MSATALSPVITSFLAEHCPFGISSSKNFKSDEILSSFICSAKFLSVSDEYTFRKATSSFLRRASHCALNTGVNVGAAFVVAAGVGVVTATGLFTFVFGTLALLTGAEALFATGALPQAVIKIDKIKIEKIAKILGFI